MMLEKINLEKQLIDSQKELEQWVNQGISPIIEYEFDTSSQIEFNKEKSKDKDVKIQSYKENTRDEVLEINRLFNSIIKDRNLFSAPF